MCPLGQEGKSNRTFRRGSDLNEAPHLILPQIAAERSFWARRQTWGAVLGSGRFNPSRAEGVIDPVGAGFVASLHARPANYHYCPMCFSARVRV